jgi:hypothetical protein
MTQDERMQLVNFLETCRVVVSIIISGSPTLLHSSPGNGDGEKGRRCERKKLTNPAITTSFADTEWEEREPMMSNELLRYLDEDLEGDIALEDGCVLLGWVVGCERRGGVHSSIILMLGT